MLSLLYVIFAVNITAMATKINEIIKKVHRESLLFSSWLSLNKIDRKQQSLYVKSGWLERISVGVYKISGEKPTIYSAISSYNQQLSRKCYVGALSALDIKGFSHFVPMGKPNAYLFSSNIERLPVWILSFDWDMNVHYSTTSLFEDSDLGLETQIYNGFELLISSPERAIMECIALAPNLFSLMDIFYVMEMLTTLRPKLVQQLLEKCTSIKVKRLFLYMAEKSGHIWFSAIDKEKIVLGSGNRHLAKNGVFISKYNITIPKELAEYE